MLTLQDEEAVKRLTATAGTKSKLAKPVQELIKTIFDVESMKKAMVEFEVRTVMHMCERTRKKTSVDTLQCKRKFNISILKEHCVVFCMKHICEYLICPFQIDLQKMPLGKLSKRQIQSAYALLTEVQQVSIRHARRLSHYSVFWNSSLCPQSL